MLLDVLGLGPAEAAAYRALIRLPSTTPAELAAHLGAGHDDTTRLLSLLEDRGLAARSLGDTTRFVAAPPAVALGALLAQRQDELRTAERELGSLDEIYRAATIGRGVADVVDVVRGPDAIRERFTQLQLGARDEVMAFVKAPVAVVGTADNAAEDVAVARGVRYRVLLERAMLDAEAGMADEIVRVTTAGEEVRIAASLPLKLFIVDRAYAFVPLIGSAEVASAGALLVHESGLLDALLALFESQWHAASQVVTAAGDIADLTPGTIDDLDARILSLLLSGLTDQAIAGQLRTSLRTVQRRVRYLMDLAQVQTRMQLGYQAARRNWA